jgi:hypothetical protein
MGKFGCTISRVESPEDIGETIEHGFSDPLKRRRLGVSMLSIGRNQDKTHIYSSYSGIRVLRLDFGASRATSRIN